MKYTPIVIKKIDLFSPLLFLAVSIALLARIGDLSFVEQSLWYEDGIIFTNQAHSLGIQSLWTPYAGYEFLYHRIVALLAAHMPLVMTPYIYFISWVIAFLSIVAVLKSRGHALGLDDLVVGCLVLAITLQPSHGEPFFNLVSSNYALGIALVFYICIPSQKPVSIIAFVFLILASLTGPFSTFIIGIMALQLVVLRDFSARKVTYLTVLVCGLIQAVIILMSGRVNSAHVDNVTAYWLETAQSLFFFGKNDRFIHIVSVSFWSLTLVFFVRWLSTKTHKVDMVLWSSPLFAAVAAILFFFAGAMGSNYYTWGEYRTISPLGMGSRYFLLPYSLFFFVGLVCTKDHRAGQAVMIALISMICAACFLSVDRPDRGSSTGLLEHRNLQWTAFTRLQKIRPDLKILINSQLPIYPPTDYVQVNKRGSEIAKRDGAILLPVPRQIGALTDSADTFPVVFDIKSYCVTNESIAFEIDIWRSRMGMAKVSWGHNGLFDPSRSFERFYPSGAAVMQFAFHRNIADSLVRFDLTEGLTESAAVRTLSYLYKDGAPPGLTFGKPTKAGGGMRIEEVRLFCLE